MPYGVDVGPWAAAFELAPGAEQLVTFPTPVNRVSLFVWVEDQGPKPRHAVCRVVHRDFEDRLEPIKGTLDPADPGEGWAFIASPGGSSPAGAATTSSMFQDWRIKNTSGDHDVTVAISGGVSSVLGAG